MERETVPRLWVDVTTTQEERGRLPHGTTRVERGIVAAFSDRPDPPGFVHFERASGRYLAVAPAALREILAAPTLADPGRRRVGKWRRRLWGLRARARRLWSRPRPPPDASADPFAPGDTVLFCGEHSRHDFARLLAQKRAKHLHFAFVLFDLLRVLEDDDPRLTAADVADLPQSDFIARVADLVLPISHFSAEAFRAHVARRATPPMPIVPIRLAGALPRAGIAVPGMIPGQFVLCVGDVVARKNHALLARVWRRVPDAPTLVIAGRIDLEGNALVDAVRAAPELCTRVRFLTDVDDDALAWLYRHCRFTVFPSRLEGFGLPVAESLAYGKPCLASSAGAIPEAGQGCALLLDPDDEAAWVDTVTRLLDDGALAEEAARIAASFRVVTWAETAADIIAALSLDSAPAQ